MSEYIIYECEWQEIEEQDRPDPGVVYICKDPQRRLCPNTWAVGKMGDGTQLGDSVTLGCFWDLSVAKVLAIALTTDFCLDEATT
jgi:hypothetical protein